MPLGQAGVRIMGTGADAIDRAEDRRLFKQMLNKLGLKQPPNDTATSVEQALEIAHEHHLPRAGAAFLRPGRAGHADRLQR